MPRKRENSAEPTEKKTQDSKPWDKQFEDDRDDEGNFSRVTRRKHTRGNTALTWVLIVAMVILCLTPIIWMAVEKRMANTADAPTRITVTSHSKSNAVSSSSVTFEESSSETTSHKAKSSSKASSHVASSSSKASSQVSSTPASSSSSSVQSSSSSSASSSSSSAANGTYTVKAGDNLYRIAVNHGMSLSDIQALNGMGSSIAIAPGQQLKVK